ncbi:tail fiber assembly protein [Cupriavidus pauculus]|uniref:tail fiber assembly protein n=1 Tax=Cupriavidus pauculus TaxID=82633 RepID=UPI003857710D
MKVFYSKLTGGFYPEDDRELYEEAGSWPADALEVPAERLALIQAQRSDGEVVADDDGLPTVRLRSHSDLDLANIVRAERDALIRATDWTQLGDVPEETRLRYVAYRQALRDVPQQPGFPHAISWPVPPDR